MRQVFSEKKVLSVIVLFLHKILACYKFFFSTNNVFCKKQKFSLSKSNFYEQP